MYFPPKFEFLNFILSKSILRGEMMRKFHILTGKYIEYIHVSFENELPLEMALILKYSHPMKPTKSKRIVKYKNNHRSLAIFCS